MSLPQSERWDRRGASRLSLLKSMLLDQLATLLNRNVAMSTQAQTLASRLEGRSLAVQVEGLPLKVRASIKSGQIAISNAAEEGADGTVSGTPLGLRTQIGLC